MTNAAQVNIVLIWIVRWMEPIWNVLCNHVVVRNINAIVMFTGKTRSEWVIRLHRCWWRILETKCVGDKLKILVTVRVVLPRRFLVTNIYYLFYWRRAVRHQHQKDGIKIENDWKTRMLAIAGWSSTVEHFFSVIISNIMIQMSANGKLRNKNLVQLKAQQRPLLRPMRT